ncbi:MAG: hypothetical protein AB7G75_06430 [Candidatus Binatia bacterium]
MQTGKHWSVGKIMLGLGLSVAVAVSVAANGVEQLFTSNVRIQTGDGPTLLLEQDTSLSLPAQTWSVLGDEVGWSISDETSGQIPLTVFQGAPSNSLTVATNGQVGVGTDTPRAPLHLFGGANVDVFVGMGPTPVGSLGTPANAVNFGYAGASYGPGAGFLNARPAVGVAGVVPPNPSLRFATANQQRMIIDNVGNVGIGDFGPGIGTAPTARLHVKGDIRVEGGSFIDDGQALNVPDYVFAPEYELMPLAELEAYIARKQHLPDVPSAQEIKANGVNISALQMQLLRKIEELTLYTLAQQKQLGAVVAQAQALTEQNARLQAQVTALLNQQSAAAR